MARNGPSKKGKSRQLEHVLPDAVRSLDFVNRLDGLSYRYDHTYQLVKYLRDHSFIDEDVLRRISECYNWARGGAFQDPAIGTKIFRSNACKQHRLCANCAHIRAKKSAMQLAEAVFALSVYYPNVKPIFTTLTVKNGPDLGERFRHAMGSFKRLQMKRKNARKGQAESIRKYVLGGLFSCEIKFTDKGLWHPHLHGLEIVPKWISAYDYDSELEKHWLEITGDSFVTRVKDIRMSTPEELIKSSMEVCKYSMKQASMTPALQYEAYKATHRKQLVRRFGVLRGFKMEDHYEKFLPKMDLSTSPFQEFLMKRQSTKKGTRFQVEMREQWSGLTKDVLRCMQDEISESEKESFGLRPLPHCSLEDD